MALLMYFERPWHGYREHLFALGICRWQCGSCGPSQWPSPPKAQLKLLQKHNKRDDGCPLVTGFTMISWSKTTVVGIYVFKKCHQSLTDGVPSTTELIWCLAFGLGWLEYFSLAKSALLIGYFTQGLSSSPLPTHFPLIHLFQNKEHVA